LIWIEGAQMLLQTIRLFRSLRLNELREENSQLSQAMGAQQEIEYQIQQLKKRNDVSLVGSLVVLMIRFLFEGVRKTKC
jgi:hypothetical protein